MSESKYFYMLNSYAYFLFCELSVQYFTPNPSELVVFSLSVSRSSAFVVVVVLTRKISSLTMTDVAYIFPSLALVFAYGFWLCISLFWFRFYF